MLVPGLRRWHYEIKKVREDLFRARVRLIGSRWIEIGRYPTLEEAKAACERYDIRRKN